MIAKCLHIQLYSLYTALRVLYQQQDARLMTIKKCENYIQRIKSYHYDMILRYTGTHQRMRHAILFVLTQPFVNGKKTTIEMYVITYHSHHYPLATLQVSVWQKRPCRRCMNTRRPGQTTASFARCSGPSTRWPRRRSGRSFWCFHGRARSV